MHILMLVMSDVVHDPRVRIEAETLVEAGHQVTVIGHQPPAMATVAQPGVTIHWTTPHQPRTETGTDAGSAPVEPTDREPPGLLARPLELAIGTARWLLLPHHRTRVQRRFARQALAIGRNLATQFDVVHAHDFTALAPAATLATEFGAALVYDAHECWTGRRLAGRPAPVRRLSQRRVERTLGGRADAIITVSDGIATWFRDAYGWDHVTVVHNSFRPATTTCRMVGPPSGIVFAGRVDPARDLRTAADALATRHDMALHVYASRIVDVDLPTTAVVHAPVSEEELDHAYRRRGLALVSLSGGMVNHDLALPNKFFHAVRAGVPVVAADLPELRRLVTTHDLGTLYRPGDQASFLRALDDVVANWSRHVAAVATAADLLSWDRDAATLMDAYDRIAHR